MEITEEQLATLNCSTVEQQSNDNGKQQFSYKFTLFYLFFDSIQWKNLTLFYAPTSWSPEFFIPITVMKERGLLF